MTRILTIIALLFATPAWAGKTFLECSGRIFSDDPRAEGKIDSQRDFSLTMTKQGKVIRFNLDNLVFDNCVFSETQYDCTLSDPTNQSSGFLRLNRVTLGVDSGVYIPMFGGKEEPIKVQSKATCRKGKQQL